MAIGQCALAVSDRTHMSSLYPYSISVVCHNQRVVGYNHPQPRYSRGTTGLQPKYNLSASLPLASLVRASCCGCG